MKSSGGGRRRARRKDQLAAAEEGSSQSAGVPVQAGDDHGGGPLQDDRSAQACDDSAAANGTAAKPKKAPRRRRALVKVAPAPACVEAAHRAGGPGTSTAGHGSASGKSKGGQTADSSSRTLLQSRALAEEPLMSSLRSAEQLSPITEGQSSHRTAVGHVCSPASEVAEGATGLHALCAEQPWTAPAEDAWCYIGSSPEHSMQASPQLAACLSSARGSPAFLPGNLDSSSRQAHAHSPGVAQVHADLSTVSCCHLSTNLICLTTSALANCSWCFFYRTLRAPVHIVLKAVHAFEMTIPIKSMIVCSTRASGRVHSAGRPSEHIVWSAEQPGRHYPAGTHQLAEL